MTFTEPYRWYSNRKTRFAYAPNDAADRRSLLHAAPPAAWMPMASIAPALLALLALLLAPPVFAATKVELALPIDPSTSVVNPITDKVYVSGNVLANTIVVIDGKTNAQTAINVGAAPGSIAINPTSNTVYIGTAVDMVVLNGANNSLTHVALGANVGAIVVDAVDNRIYIANSSNGDVTVMSGAGNNVLATIATGSKVAGMALNPLTHTLFATQIESKSVAVIDTLALEQIATVAVGDEPSAIIVNPITNRIYVADVGDGGVTVIAGETLGTTFLQGQYGLIQFVLDKQRNRIYIPCFNSDTLMIIDGASNAVNLLTVPGLPLAVVLDPVTDKLYLGSQSTHALIVLDGDTDAILQSIPISDGSDGGYPADIAFNPITAHLYIANAGRYTLDVIDATDTLIDDSYDLYTDLTPLGLAVNPGNGLLYVANSDSNTVNVIDESRQSNTRVAVGSQPVSVAVDVVNGEAYVVNRGSNNVSILTADGNKQTVAVGNTPLAVAANPVTHRAYVINSASNSVSVIDRANGTVGTIAVGAGPQALVVDPGNGKIYVANIADNSVSVIDGASGMIDATVPVGASPIAIASDPVTHRVYVANRDSNSLSVIQSNAVLATIAVNGSPLAVAVNPNSKRVYVTASSNPPNKLNVIDATSNTLITYVPVQIKPVALALDTTTNKIFVANSLENTVIMVDEASLLSTIIPVGSTPAALAVNPVIHRAYVSNSGNDYIASISQQLRHTPLSLQIPIGLRFHASAATQTFALTPDNNEAPYAQPATGVYYQVDNVRGAWSIAASDGNGGFSGGFSALNPGTHTLFAFAVDGSQAGSGGSENPSIGDMAAYSFTVVDPPTLAAASPADGSVGNAYAFSYAGNSIAPLYYQMTAGSLPPGLTLSPQGTISGTPTLAGVFSGTVTASNGALPDPAQNFSINITQAPSFINTPPNGVINTPYAFDYQVLGTPTPTFALLSGSLPPGLILNSSGHIGGTPTTTGNFSFAVSIDNGVGIDATQAIMLTIGQAPLITTSAPPDGTVATPYTFAYASSGFPTSSFSLQSGTLPPGLALSTAGLLSGTPTSPGSYSGSVKADNGIGSDATQNFNITITQAPSITSTAPPGGHFSVAYSFSFSASGSPAPSFALGSGTLPPGLTLTSAGLLSGKPSLAGTYTGMVLASNGVGSGASQNFSIVIDTDRIFASGFEVQ